MDGWIYTPFRLEEFSQVYQTVGLDSTKFFQEFRGSMFSLYLQSLKRGAVFLGRFLVAPIITENFCIQLSIGGGGNVHSLYSSCELGLLSGHLQMRSFPVNPDPTCGNDWGIYSLGLSRTRGQD